MDGIDFMYFILNNMTSIMAIVIILGTWFWNSAQRNAELKIEEERRIVESKKQEESMQMAIEMFQRQTNQFREKEMQMQKAIERIELENQNLRNNHRILNELNEERRRLHREDNTRVRRRQEQLFNKNENNNTLKNIGSAIQIIGSIAMIFMAGKKAFN